MQEIIFLVATIVFGASATMGHRMDSASPIDRPISPEPVRTITAMSGWAGLIAIGWGFFAFSWWLPLLVIPLYMVIGVPLAIFGLKSYRAPLIAMLLSIAGFGLIGLILLSRS